MAPSPGRTALLLHLTTLVLLHTNNVGAIMAGYRASRSTLSFQVCNGYTNQRLSILYGFVLAKTLGRHPVLPRLILDGVQGMNKKPSKVQLTLDNAGGFFTFYDRATFTHFMHYAGVEYIEPDHLQASRVVSLNLTQRSMAALPTKYAMARHVVVDCPLLKIPRHVLEQEHVLVMHLLYALQPSVRWRRMLQRGKRYIAKHGPAYNFLHLRLEQDWLQHCALPNMAGHRNCVVKVNNLHTQLLAQGFNTSLPLYVAAQWQLMDRQLALGVLRRLRSAGYNVLLQHKVFNKCAKRFTREEAAMMDYYLAMDAHQFAGNSVSTFSALLMLERRLLHGRPSWHYNGGGIPLARYVPFYDVDEPEELPVD